MQDCSLILESEAIRKQILYDRHTDDYVGFVKYKAAIVDPDEQPATEALAFLLTGLQGHWKCPIGYFLINKISANVHIQIARIALTEAAEIDLRVVCVTCDGIVIRNIRRIGTVVRMYEFISCYFFILIVKGFLKKCLPGLCKYAKENEKKLKTRYTIKNKTTKSESENSSHQGPPYYIYNRERYNVITL